MLTPATILRDAALAGLLLSLVGLTRGFEIGAAVAAGVLGSLVNLFLMRRALARAGAAPAAFVLGRLLLKTIAGGAVLLVLLATLPAGPVMLGFCSVLFGLAARACVLLLTAKHPSTMEPG